ncbi:MAG: hypothetical protein QNJ34_11035 [Xenococcaceae cyanobacterium MO_188.B29]|nr:hypothetical protein [Xenococcaceae cyanobacterium MO_188.B29]
MESALSQLKLKEQEINQKEYDLKVNADVLSRLYRQWIINGNQVRITLGELELWRRQAKAIERSPSHLATIDGIIESIQKTVTEENNLLPTCEIDLVVFEHLLHDRKEFNELAFSLISQQMQPKLNFDFELNFDEK